MTDTPEKFDVAAAEKLASRILGERHPGAELVIVELCKTVGYACARIRELERVYQDNIAACARVELAQVLEATPEGVLAAWDADERVDEEAVATHARHLARALRQACARICELEDLEDERVMKWARLMIKFGKP